MKQDNVEINSYQELEKKQSGNKKIILIIISVLFLVGLIGVTYAFFNYTRTGSENTIQVGRISFETTHGPAININNIFPIDSANIDTETDYVGSVTINVKGDTDYSEGIEYAVSAVDVNNNVGTNQYTKSVPISVDISVSSNVVNNETTTLGTANNNYFNDGVRGGNTSYYKVVAPESIRNNDKLVVGYIAPGSTGVNGNIVVRAFIDKDLVAISDTAPAEFQYLVKSNMSAETNAACVSYFTSLGFNNYLSGNETLSDLCYGTGTIMGDTLEEAIKNGNLVQSDVDELINLNVIELNNDYEPINTWLGTRRLYTTTEWNSLEQDGISFKIKVEANEGIWVDEPGKIGTCPDCKFMYSDNVTMYTTWNTLNKTPTVVTSGLYDSYLDITGTGINNHFMGLVLNENNEITKAYGCGIKNDIVFCIEDTTDNTTYVNKQTVLQSERLWNNGCIINTSGSYGTTTCGQNNYNSFTMILHDHGCVDIRYHSTDNLNYRCYLEENGRIRCSRT